MGFNMPGGPSALSPGSRVGERIIYWTWVPLVAILVAAFVLFPGFIPPMSPRASAEEVAAFYRDDLRGCATA